MGMLTDDKYFNQKNKIMMEKTVKVTPKKRRKMTPKS